jgi:hypothetical protein
VWWLVNANNSSLNPSMAEFMKISSEGTKLKLIKPLVLIHWMN